jgi:hypothetical protein
VGKDTYLLTNTGQLLAAQHIDDACGTDGGVHRHDPDTCIWFALRDDLPDDTRFAAKPIPLVGRGDETMKRSAPIPKRVRVEE